MRSELLVLAAVGAVHGLPQAEPEAPADLQRRLMNGLGKTPALGWNGWVWIHSHLPSVKETFTRIVY
jgi:hypothetical protein